MVYYENPELILNTSIGELRLIVFENSLTVRQPDKGHVTLNNVKYVFTHSLYLYHGGWGHYTVSAAQNNDGGASHFAPNAFWKVGTPRIERATPAARKKLEKVFQAEVFPFLKTAEFEAAHQRAVVLSREAKAKAAREKIAALRAQIEAYAVLLEVIKEDNNAYTLSRAERDVIQRLYAGGGKVEFRAPYEGDFIYPHWLLLFEKGLMTYWKGERRRVYELTETGKLLAQG